MPGTKNIPSDSLALSSIDSNSCPNIKCPFHVAKMLWGSCNFGRMSAPSLPSMRRRADHVQTFKAGGSGADSRRSGGGAAGLGCQPGIRSWELLKSFEIIS